jgi:hypothetical protein
MKTRLLTLSLAAGLGAACGPPDPQPNACQGRQEGDLVITEAMIDPDGTDTGNEWFEVFNTLGTPIELRGLTLYVRDTNGSGAKSHTIRAGTIPPRSYFTFGDIRSGPNPAWINYSYADGLGALGNSRGVIGVRCGQTTLAEITYTRAARAGRSRMLDGVGDPTPALAAVEENFCDTPPGNVYFGNNAGTPGAANPRCIAEATAGTCVDQGTVRPMTAPQAGDLLITEVMARPAATSSTTGEWFEVLARAAVDLNDVTLYTTTSSTRITAQECLRVQPGEYVLLARSADSFVNGGLPPPRVVYGSVSFPDTSNTRIGLRRGDAGIDEISLFPSSRGRAWQLDPDKLDPTLNDDPQNFCVAPNRWNPDGGGDYGSPGAANPACVFIDAGMLDPGSCIDPDTEQPRPVRHAGEGQLVLTEWMPDPAAVGDAEGEYFEVQATADLDLNGVSLLVGTSRTNLSSPMCLAVTANSFLVFGKNNNSQLNGNLPVLTAVFTGTLANTSGTISVLAVDGGTLSAISYTGSRAGASQQVDPNDGGVCDTPANVRYGLPLDDGGIGGDRGTPGQPNVPCP